MADLMSKLISLLRGLVAAGILIHELVAYIARRFGVISPTSACSSAFCAGLKPCPAGVCWRWRWHRLPSLNH